MFWCSISQAMLARNARIRVPLVATVTTVPTSASARTAATAPTPTACASASRAGRDYCVNRRVERDSMAKAVRSSATVITMVPATTLPVIYPNNYWLHKVAPSYLISHFEFYY